MNPCQISIFLLAALLISTSPAFAEKSQGFRQKFKQLESQLEGARESMHQAQRELARKSERIQELERQLKLLQQRQDPGKAAMEKLRQEVVSLRKKNGELARDLAIARKESANRHEGSDRKDPPKVPSKKSTPKKTESITIRYEENSAANFEGREKVLKWIEGQMNKGAKRFSIEGFADDSEYTETNEVIARNRAKYLADYLVLRGIPEKVLSLDSSVAEAKGGKGRYVVVSTVGR